jgi:four helix bundle protein
LTAEAPAGGGGLRPEPLHVAVSSKAERDINHMLRIYEIIIVLVALLKVIFDSISQKDADLARQGRRAATSIALNTAEASGVRGGNRRLRLLTALGSAREVEAVCDLGEALGYAKVDTETREVLNHVIGALVLLTR